MWVKGQERGAYVSLDISCWLFVWIFCLMNFKVLFALAAVFTVCFVVKSLLIVTPRNIECWVDLSSVLCNYPPQILKSSGDIVLALSVRPSIRDSFPHCFSATNDWISMKLCGKIHYWEEMRISFSCPGRTIQHGVIAPDLLYIM